MTEALPCPHTSAWTNWHVCACRVASIPGELFTGATSLWLLCLNTNPITSDQIRGVPGWAAYDARRRQKADKQVGWDRAHLPDLAASVLA